jgi:hypothetical protein
VLLLLILAVAVAQEGVLVLLGMAVLAVQA